MSKWVKCPVCGAPDMEKTEDGEGCFINCTNEACLSNGGDNFDACVNRITEASLWSRIDTLPICDDKFDVYAKWWNSDTDKFDYRRFTDCYWRSTNPGVEGSRQKIEGVDKGWRPVAWMLIPECKIPFL